MSEMCALFRLLLAGNCRSLLCGVLISSITACAGVALLGLSGWFLTSSALVGIGGRAAIDLAMPSAGIRLLALVRAAGRYGERMLTHVATMDLLLGLRRMLFIDMTKADVTELGRMQTGEAMNTLVADVDRLDAAYIRILVPLTAATISLVLGCLGISLLDPVLSGAIFCIYLGVLASAFVMALRFGKRTGRFHSLARRSMRTRMLDLAAGKVELLFAGQIEGQERFLAKASDAERAANALVVRAEAAMVALFTMTGQVVMILVLWRGSALVRNGDLAVTDLALVCLAVLGLWDAFGPVPRGLAGIGQTARAAGRVVPRLSVLDDNPPATSPFVPCAFFRAPSQGEILLEMKDMSFAWPGGRRPVLYNVDLVLRAGDRVMLTAPSGAGKSTLLMLAAGHLLPSSGLVRPGSMDSRTRHRSVALLSQRSTIFAGSVAENLRLASPGASNDDLWRVLDAAGLRDHVGGLRDGLDGMLGEAGMSLSGGQARRLAIARVLLRDPAVLLLDEPTEGIEDQLAAEIMLAISRSLPRASIVFSMHRALEHDIGQRRLRLCDGRLKMHAESAASVRCETISVPTDHDTRSASRFRMVSGTGSF